MLTAIPLTEAQSEEIARLLASGACADASEVVAAGLEALAAQEASIEAWLQREVAPAAEALAADPSRALSSDQVRAAIRAHRAAWESGAAG
jgi:Arc/MetJ-type ribon-helix-helix transcriptional regulator